MRCSSSFNTLHATVAYLSIRNPFICLNLGATKEVSVLVHVDLEESVDWHTSMFIKRGYKQISCARDELVLEKIVGPHPWCKVGSWVRE